MEALKRNIIAGPCALESREQLVLSITELKKLGIKHIRASLWKPRTSPGWEGYAFYGIPMLFDETFARETIPCTEILTAFHAQMMVDALRITKKESEGAIVWLGARNQNHFEQKRIASILKSGPPALLFMFKNQIWYDVKHWYGIYEHIISADFPKERLIACHRGFTVGYGSNPEGLRNIPEFELAMEMKEKMGIPMYLDPSHIGGEREKVKMIIERSLDYDFDGYLIEAHDRLVVPKTDASQQLSFEEIGEVIRMINNKTYAPK